MKKIVLVVINIILLITACSKDVNNNDLNAYNNNNDVINENEAIENPITSSE